MELLKQLKAAGERGKRPLAAYNGVATDALSVQLASIKIGFRVLGSLHIFCGGRSSPESIALSIAAQNAASIFSSSARMRISSIANSSCMIVFPISLR